MEERAKHNPSDIARPPDECASCVRGATQKEGGLRARARARVAAIRASTCTRCVALAPLCIIQCYACSPPSLLLSFLFAGRREVVWVDYSVLKSEYA